MTVLTATPALNLWGGAHADHKYSIDVRGQGKPIGAFYRDMAGMYGDNSDTPAAADAGFGPLRFVVVQKVVAQQITVVEAAKPATGNFGAFAWPVNFELANPSNAQNGGWIVQHVVRTVTFSFPDARKRLNGKDVSRGGYNADYWEAWRVTPGAKSAASMAIDPAMARALDKFNVTVPDVMANDWFGMDQSLLTRGSAGVLKQTGQVFFLDNMKEGDMPWVAGTVGLAGNLQSIYTAGNSRAIADLVGKYTAAGPVTHNIQVSWFAAGPKIKTNIDSITPEPAKGK